MAIFNNIFLHLYEIIVNLETNNYVSENRIKIISSISLFLLLLSMLFVLIATIGFVLSMLICGFEPVITTFYSLMFLGLILVIISHILIKKTNPYESEDLLLRFRIIPGIIGLLLEVGLFIGAYYINTCSLF